MSADDRFYERGCKALLLAGALIHWTAAAILMDELFPPEPISHFAGWWPVFSDVVSFF
jgi:hypothetical protein